MRKTKFPINDMKKALQEIDKLSKRLGIDLTKWACAKWNKNIADRHRLEKQRKELESRLEVLNKRL